MKTRRIVSLMGSKPGHPGELINKIVVYDDNGKMIDCKPIEKDNNGYEYYRPSNPNGPLKLFLGRIKDAIECIRNDKGDDVSVSRNYAFSPYGSVRVIRYLDRNYGEILRQQSIKEWEGIKFVYSIKFSRLNSFGSYLLCKDTTPYTYDDATTILTFDQKEDADKYISNLMEKAKKYYDAYKLIDEADGPANKAFFDKLYQENNGRKSIMLDLLIEFDDLKNNKPNYTIEVIQSIKPEENKHEW